MRDRPSCFFAFSFLRSLVVAALLGSLFGSPARAARPLVTDDARVVDAHACQVESWVKTNRNSTEYWALPACNLTGNLELTLGGARTGDDGGTHTSDVQIQGKTVFTTLKTNGWGMGLVLGTIYHPHPANASREQFAYVPTSFSFRNDGVVLHTNVGWIRGEARRDRLTWGIGTEARLAVRTWLIAETFGQNQGKPFHQIGLRHWLVPDRVQLDATYGIRNGDQQGERWFSIGLRLLTPPLF